MVQYGAEHLGRSTFNIGQQQWSIHDCERLVQRGQGLHRKIYTVRPREISFYISEILIIHHEAYTDEDLSAPYDGIRAFK